MKPLRRVITRRTFASTAILALAASKGSAADLSARDLAGALFKSTQGNAPDLSGKDLSRLDLSELDFKGAKLKRVNLFGADLSRANLSTCDLGGAVLDRCAIVGTNFDHANLEGVSMYWPSVFSNYKEPAKSSPSFVGANLKKSRIAARLWRADLSGADLSYAYCAPYGRIEFIEPLWRTELTGAKLEGAILEHAQMMHTVIAFANLRNARLSHASLFNTDLSRSDLTGADLTGADMTDADVDGTILKDVRGLDTVIGFDSVKNADKMIR